MAGVAPRDDRGPIAPSGPDRAPIAPSGPDQGEIALSLVALLYGGKDGPGAFREDSGRVWCCCPSLFCPGGLSKCRNSSVADGEASASSFR